MVGLLPDLQELSMEKNQISDATCAVLAEQHPINNTLRVLRLGINKIADKAVSLPNP